MRYATAPRCERACSSEQVVELVRHRLEIAAVPLHVHERTSHEHEHDEDREAQPSQREPGHDGPGNAEVATDSILANELPECYCVLHVRLLRGPHRQRPSTSISLTCVQ